MSSHDIVAALSQLKFSPEVKQGCNGTLHSDTNNLVSNMVAPLQDDVLMVAGAVPVDVRGVLPSSYCPALCTSPQPHFCCSSLLLLLPLRSLYLSRLLRLETNWHPVWHCSCWLSPPPCSPSFCRAEVW